MNEYQKNEMLVEAEGLIKIYRGRQVVRGVSINVRAGEVVGLFGPNGAGKTTSFYMVMGLVRPEEGTVKFRGVDVTHMPMYLRARMGMGYLAQEPSIFRKLTVEENIMAILQTLDISGRERKERCEALMEDLGLTKLRNQKAMTLSGGERRRLEITRAMVTNPAFIMLDEPFSGVDPLAVSNVRDIILRLKNERNLGILITDHNVGDALKVVDRAYIMADGKVLVEGTSDYLINDPEAQKVYFGKDYKI